MKNYEEKEKKLDIVLKKLNSMSNKVVNMNNDINLLSIEKNQILSEKKESERNFKLLSEQHEQLKGDLERINKDVFNKFDSKRDFSQKIDELNQETENLIDEIDKWQT